MNKGTLIVNGIDYSNGGGVDEIYVFATKNLLNCDNFKVARTIAGVTFTPVFDAKGFLQYVNVNGKATSEAVLALTYNALYTRNARYILSGCTGGSASTYALYWEGHAGQFDAEVAVTESSINKQVVKIVVKNGITMNNVKFYPMIRLATEPTGYVPFNGDLSLEGKISNKVDRNGDTMAGPLGVPTITDTSGGNSIEMSNEDIEMHVYSDGAGLEIYGYPNLGGFEGLILRIRADDENVGAVITNGIGKINILAPNGLLLNGFELKKTVPADAKFTDTTYNNATQTSSGLMSADDKKKLDTMVTGSTTKIREFSFHWDSMYIKSNGGNPMINYSNELMSVTNVKNYWFELEDAWPLETWDNGACVFIQSVYRDSLNFVLGTTQSQSYRCTVRMFVVYEE